jgi:2,4-dienoyl-CoA reductase-like NADH-dependent reductase (Old Yellow Enzyme family)
MLAPMTTDASERDGTVSAEEVEYMRRRSANGFGTLITACAYVHEDGLSWRGIGASDDEHLESLKGVAEAMRAGGGLAILQIYDGGRIARPELVGISNTRAPSAVPSLRPGAVTPREMQSAEVETMVDRFRAAAVRAKQAGFDGVEIHGANHYLVHQFISPRSNHRADTWGGDNERRMNFPIAVAQAVRSGVGPELVVGFRITPFEAEAGGITLDYSARLCDRLATLSIDYIHISMDDYRSNSPIREDRSWSQPLTSARVKEGNPLQAISQVVRGRCAVAASGGVKTQADAMGAVDSGADLVAVGRAALIDPEWLTKVKQKEEHLIATSLPFDPEEISTRLTIPRGMVDYLLSRPSWIPREGTAH